MRAALRREARALWYLRDDVRLAADRRSLLALHRLRRGRGSGAVEVRLAPLGGRPALLRALTTDAQVAWYTLRKGAHREPSELCPDLGLVVDIGANIGLTMADFLARHPRVRVVGVEMDPGNARIARTNTAAWGDRAEVITAAVWPAGDRVAYTLTLGSEDGASVAPTGSGPTAEVVTPTALLERVGTPVDFVKLNVEGAEKRLLADPSWLACVRGVAVAVHDPYSPTDCARDLAAAGLRTRVRGGPHPWVVGWREPE